MSCTTKHATINTMLPVAILHFAVIHLLMCLFIEMFIIIASNNMSSIILTMTTKMYTSADATLVNALSHDGRFACINSISMELIVYAENIIIPVTNIIHSISVNIMLCSSFLLNLALIWLCATVLYLCILYNLPISPMHTITIIMAMTKNIIFSPRQIICNYLHCMCEI